MTLAGNGTNVYEICFILIFSFQSYQSSLNGGDVCLSYSLCYLLFKIKPLVDVSLYLLLLIQYFVFVTLDIYSPTFRNLPFRYNELSNSNNEFKVQFILHLQITHF